MVYSDFNLNIPVGSTINYVEIGFEGYTDGRTWQFPSPIMAASISAVSSLPRWPLNRLRPIEPSESVIALAMTGTVPFSPASFSAMSTFGSNYRHRWRRRGGNGRYLLPRSLPG